MFLMVFCLILSSAFGQAEIELAKASNIAKGLAAVGAGLAAIGAGIGIGMLASAAANATSRQPEAANEIRSVAYLPLFLLEGVAIIGLVVCLLATF